VGATEEVTQRTSGTYQEDRSYEESGGLTAIASTPEQVLKLLSTITKENIMSHSDRQLMNALREVIATEMRQQIAIEVDTKLKERFDNQDNSFDIEDHRESIETIISEFLTYNVNITIEA
jgi:RNA polymerase-interacting CarD/CdnL/TRCF family regulator